MHKLIARTATALVGLTLLLGGSACTSDDANEVTEEPAETIPSSAKPLSSIAGLPEREPEVTGVVGANGEFPTAPYLVEQSDDYYEGMSLASGEPVVLDDDSFIAADFAAGDRVSIWIGDGCAESFPVQCTFEAILITSKNG